MKWLSSLFGGVYLTKEEYKDLYVCILFIDTLYNNGLEDWEKHDVSLTQTRIKFENE